MTRPEIQIAGKIAERAPEIVVRVGKVAPQVAEEDDPYAAFKIPDDFTS